ncbi:MAG TPA: deoxyribose-phosphate aldolase [Terriglobia bacterium]|nr:deoxyribose-phosphate aldolase [Terriglobia bacterium]
MPRRIVTTEDVQAAQGGELRLPAGSIVTESAREFAAELGVKLLFESAPVEAGCGGGAPANSSRRIALAGDHAGFELKEYLKRFLSDAGYAVVDLGTNSTEPVDYPDFARSVAESVASGKAWRGVLVDGAGIGSAIAANKVPGARAALCYDRATARSSREHNDANVLTLGARLMPPEAAREVTAVWLETQFAGGRHQKRVDKITGIEQAPAGFAGGLRPASRPEDGGAQSGTETREELVEAATREVLCRLGDQRACALRGLEMDEAACPGCDGRCAESCPVKSRRVVAAGAARLGAGLGVTQVPSDLARLIDHTLLKPEATEADIRRLCAEARDYGFATVCVNLAWVSLCAAELSGTAVKVCTVAGFPLGATAASVKNFETEQAVKLGAAEIDMVINVGALKSGYYERVEQEIRALADTCHRGGAIQKVILECALLTDQEKVIASRLAKSAAADFVKTSTGFGPGGATAHDVEIMRLVTGPEMGVKAAGGIRNYEDLRKMLSAGATRIGASASVKIMHEAAGETPPGAY